MGAVREQLEGAQREASSASRKLARETEAHTITAAELTKLNGRFEAEAEKRDKLATLEKQVGSPANRA